MDFRRHVSQKNPENKGIPNPTSGGLTGIGKKLPKADNRRADGTLIRGDGMRIALS